MKVPYIDGRASKVKCDGCAMKVPWRSLQGHHNDYMAVP